MRTAFISHPDCLRHEMFDGHPECSARLRVVDDHLQAAGLFDFLLHFTAPKAQVKQLDRVHAMGYAQEIIACTPNEGLFHIDDDTAMNPNTPEAALRAAGAVVLATDKVLQGEVDNAFCNVRPPGHHAERSRAMGFCFFNNVAVGVGHALEEYGLERIAVLDFDVHHGNGTEDIFYGDRRVMVCSSFQHPFYPYSGRDTVDGHLVNVRLKAGSIGADFRQAIQHEWIPQLERFKPQMIFISAGFDAHYEEDMADLNLGERDYAWVTTRIMEIAQKYANNRIVSSLEGGYALNALGRSVTAHVRTLMAL